MKKVLFCLLLITLFISPREIFAQEFRKAENITLSENETITQDFFAAGRNIIISGNIDGDTYLAGENILIDGTINGDLILVGKTVTIEGDIQGNLRAIGKELKVYGNVQENITWVGESISVSPPATIAGSLTSVAKEVSLNTPLGRGATLAGKNISIDSQINGNLLAAAGEKFFLNENAKIEGDVNYYTGTGLKMTQASTASVSGETTHNIYVTDREMHLETPPFLAGVYLFFKILSLLSLLVSGTLLTFFLPRYSQNVAKQIDAHFLKSLIIGLLILVLTPGVIIFLIITLIGIPIALLLTPLYLALLFFGSIFSILFLGKQISAYLNQEKKSQTFKFLLGLAAFAIFTFVPIFGPILSFAAVTLGIGAFTLEKIRLFKYAR